MFWRLSLIFLFIFVLLGAAYIYIATNAARRFYDETNQKLNSQVARHMLEEVKPFVGGEVNEEALGVLMHSMMAVNPNLEVYLLDPTGKILTYVVLKEKVKLSNVSLDPIHEFLNNTGETYVLGDDPRKPGKQSIFSVAEIRENDKLLGYAYLVLASEEYENASSALSGSYWLRISTRSFIITLVSSLLLGLVLIALLTKNLRVIVNTVSEFEEGNLMARIPEKGGRGELAQLSLTFNKMADTILHNIDELKNVDKLRRELIANVSHDLRNPLAIIHGYIETLIIKEEKLTGNQRREYLEIILKSSNKLKTLIVDLFELSKLEAGQIKAKKEPFFLNELLYDASRKFQLLAEEKNISLEYSIDKVIPMVYADISLIDRAVQNLLENAIKYTPESGWITLGLEQENDKVKVKVINSGDGIAEKDIEAIFERYYKVAREPEQGEGSGLGLAIVKKIMDIHQANIAVESVPNNYTNFYFELPVIQ